MAVRCPGCGAALAEGALRCRFCEADARGARPGRGVAVSFTLFDVAPEQAEVATLLDELAESAPAVAAWFRSAPRPTRERIVEVLRRLLVASYRR